MKSRSMNNKLIIILLVMCSVNIYAQSDVTLVVGTYTNKCESNGIYVYSFDTETAAFTMKSASDKMANPSFLTISEDGNFIYAVNETGDNSHISSMFFKPDSGATGFIGKVDAQGSDPCYIIDDAYNVISANYSDGSVAVFKKNRFGSLDNASQVIRYSGNSIDMERQERPHLHFVQFTPDLQYVVANDLGTDQVYLYKYTPELKEPLKLHQTVPVRKGSGPRHLEFSKDGKFAYLLQELDGTLTVFSYGAGRLSVLQETSIVDKDFKGKTGAADIHISADGKFLYASNRGEANDISVFAIGADGKLTFIERQSTLGKGPRNFAIDPSGKFLLVAHQDSDDIVVFRIDPVSGKLQDSGKRLQICSPVCLKFIAKQN
jgi:6-phosphogluconolactonase